MNFKSLKSLSNIITDKGLVVAVGVLVGFSVFSQEAVAQNRRARPARRVQPTPTPAPVENYAEPIPRHEPIGGYREASYEPSREVVRDVKRAPDTLWITSQGRFSVQGDFTYSTSKRDVRNTANVKEGEFTLTGTRFDINGEFGINKNIAIRAGTSYASITNDWGSSIQSTISSSTKAVGIGDFIVGGRALYQRDQFLMAGEFNLGISPADARVAGPSMEGNQFSGGFSINPKIGGAYSVGRAGWIGGLLSYNFRLERNVIQATGGSSKVSGGSELSPLFFYEHQFNNMYINPSFQYISVSDSTRTVGTTSLSSGGGSRFVYAFEGGIYPIPALRLSAAYSLTSVPDQVVDNRTELSNYLHAFIVSGRMQF